MKNLNTIIKNTLIFLIVFMAINYFIGNKNEEKLIESSGNLIFATTDNEYSIKQKVTLNIENNTSKDIIIPNECPGEPFNVFRYENNEWVQKSSNPEIDCENSKEITLKPTQNTKIIYKNWNYSLFSELGRYKIEFTTNIEGTEKTISTNEFLVVKEGIIKQIWFGVFYRPIYNGLIYLTKVIPGHSLGLAIIILTLIIRTILLIPSQKAMKSQKKMQDIQPRLENIKQKYKGDQQKIAMETMAIWKEAKVNPMGSCLPILLQFPFLIAIFYVIQDGLNPDTAYLLYKQYEGFGLHNININFFSLDLTKVNTYILPLIVGGLQFAQMKLSLAKATNTKKNKGKEEKNEMAMASNMMIYLMPVMIAVFTASLPAGVGIYWGTSTLYGVIQQLFVNKEASPISSNSKEVKVKVIEK